ncbi:hypothetical protein [Microbacterium sp.]|uniref:hypothetical protein n=1 Tax=Microbacterium sp. TaxID=51671 RepID=UPI003F998239
MTGELRTPRAAEEPMAFTRAEFRQGAFAAWGAFMILLIATLIVTAVLQSGLPWGPPLATIVLYLMFGVPIGGVVSALVTLAAAPVVRVIARRLARTRRISVHVTVYAAFGALLGLILVSVSVLLTRGDYAYTFSSPLPWATAALCALALVSGWGWTVWRNRCRPAR